MEWASCSFASRRGCSHYVGSDFSKVALDYVGTHLQAHGALGHGEAVESRMGRRTSTGIADDSLDTIVLNSIILDFPSMPTT